jgi:FSR family fosmidomycin resistance protein-like MFS transporter
VADLRHERGDDVDGGTVRRRRSPLAWSILLGLGHAVDDFYPSFLAPLLPLFVERLGLSLAMAGGLATLQGFTTSLVQPLFGYFADRHQRPTMAAWGILASVVFTSLWGLAPGGVSLTVLVVLAGLGAALFHPVASGLVGQMARDRRGLGMSLFVTGGSVGYGLGPLVAVALVSRWGLPALAWAAIPGVLTTVYLYRATRGLHLRVAPAAQPALRDLLTGQLLPLSLLTGVVMLRAALALILGTFLPLYLSQRGFPLLMGGLAVSVFRVAGAAGGLVGGPLSDRLGRKPVLFMSFVLALPFLWAFFRAEGWLAMGFLAAAGVIITFAMPVSILMAQEAAPESPSMASGLMIGFAWGLGGLAVTAVGWWADHVGLPMAFNVSVMVMAVAAAVAVLFLRVGSPRIITPAVEVES